MARDLQLCITHLRFGRIAMSCQKALARPEVFHESGWGNRNPPISLGTIECLLIEGDLDGCQEEGSTDRPPDFSCTLFEMDGKMHMLNRLNDIFWVPSSGTILKLSVMLKIFFSGGRQDPPHIPCVTTIVLRFFCSKKFQMVNHSKIPNFQIWSKVLMSHFPRLGTECFHHDMLTKGEASDQYQVAGPPRTSS